MTDTQLQDLQNQAIDAGREAVLDAVETHRRMGHPIVVWEDGQITHIQPKDLIPRQLPHDEPDDMLP